MRKMKVTKETPIWIKYHSIAKNFVMWAGCDLGYWTIPLVGFKIQQGHMAFSLGFLCFRIGFYWWRRGKDRFVCLRRYITYPVKERERVEILRNIMDVFSRWSVQDLKYLKNCLEYENQNNRN